MDKLIFVVFKKREAEVTNAYSLVDQATLNTIPSDIIHAKKEVDKKLYSTEELNKLRDDLV